MKKKLCLTLCGVANLFLLCFGAWASEGAGSELSEARQVAQYNYVIHILAMLLVGFGFLMVFVRRYGFGATTGSPFVADLPAHTGGSARKRRNSSGVIMRFHFHQDVRLLIGITIRITLAGVEARDFRSLHDGGIIGVGHHRTLRMLLMGMANHRE